MFLEVYRDFVPTTKIISDNVGQHHRTHQMKLKYHGDRMRNIMEGFITPMDGFVVPTVKQVQKISQNQFTLILEMWKYKNIRFDLLNYTMTFKAQTDVLTSLGYWEDDNWKFLSPGIASGGGRMQWGDAIRYDGDGLPDELTYDWWIERSDISSTFVRMIATDLKGMKLKNLV